jgi:NitT/TauT family transport system substrate-binding protein
LKHLTRHLCGLALAAATILCVTGGSAWAQNTKITVGEIAPIALFWPDFIAQKQGFYAKEGLDANAIFVGSVASAVQQVIGGSVDFAFTTAETAIRAADRGGDVVIIGETVKKWPYSFMAAKDIRKPQDLKGKTCILSTPKQDFFWIWNQWLRDQGMKVEDVDQVFDGATPNRYAALAAGAVQCAALSQPFDFRAIAEGYTQLADISFYGKEYAFVVVAARRSYVQANPQVARSFMRAIANAVDWFYDPANKEQAIGILMEVSKQQRPVIEQTYDYYFTKVKPYSAGAVIPESGMRNLVDTLVDAGEIKPIRDLSRYMDTSYLRK